MYSTTAHTQTLNKVSETDTFTDYVLSNDSLNVDYRFELTIPFDRNRQTWRIIEQEVVRRAINQDDTNGNLDHILMDVPQNQPVVHVENPGIYRKQQVASLLLHVVRRDADNDQQLLITKNLRIRVYNEKIWAEQSVNRSREVQSDQNSPLASGNWYKIPITRDGIYVLDRTYLQNLGIEVGNIDPRNIQIWSTDGYEMPRLNSIPRPEFKQVPIMVTGQANGQLNNADVVLFYGNSQNEVFLDSTRRFAHRIHPYSNSNYVFLTIGNEPGIRLQEVRNSQPASHTLTTFTDFIWKEEDIRRPDNRTKSGIHWYGQQFSTESFARNQTILTDTLVGFVQGSTLDISVEMIARSTRNSRFQFTIGSTNVGAIQLGGITDLNSASGRAANRGQLNQTLTGINLPDGVIELNADFTTFANEGFGWVDWIRISGERQLQAQNGILKYWAPTNGQLGEVANFTLQGFSNMPTVMEVSDPLNPILMAVDASGSNFTVRHRADAGKRFMAQTRYLRPSPGVAIPSQNIRGVGGYPEYIIITSDELLPEADDLAEYRRSHTGLETVVVTQNQIFNEFSGGVPDITAIRDYVRYLYLRAGLDDDRIPKNLLLFGNTTFDYRGINQNSRMINHVFTFQSEESLNRSTTYGSDDYFVLLDENEGVWQPTQGAITTFERIDMGVGRLPVQTNQEAQVVVEKIKRYEDPATFGDWRTIFTFSSDDNRNGSSEDFDLHVWNSDGTAERIDRDNSGVRINKVYQISYPVINTPLGRQTPEGTQAFINSINNGSLVMNFSGHGSEQLLTAERLFSSDDISRLNNIEKPTIFVTATCDFGRFDDIDDYSGAEKLINWSNGGAIAAFTTTRVVFTSSSQTSYNFGLNIQLTLQMVQRDSEGLPQTLGDIYKNTKNTTVGASFNSRKFVLLGDPAMRIGLPQTQVEITAINDIEPQENQAPITLRALDQATISGQILNPDGSLNAGFNGEAAIQVYDADRFIRITRTRCLSLPGCQYRVQNDVIFSGRVSVTDGLFSSQFIVPNDISYADTTGRILIYGSADNRDAVGSFSNIVFNGRNPDAINDNQGPDIQIFLNNTDFMDGGLVNDSPRLLVQLEDQSGINTAGAGVGHELLAYISRRPDGGNEETIILNNFYQSDLDDFTKGRVEYPLDRLPTGEYTLRVRAWDVFNNMNEESITFEVADSQNLELRNVYNYPNPMSNYTRFVFEHNQAGRELDVLIRVYTLSGKPVARIRRDNFISSGNLIQLPWDGRDDDGNLLAAGTYLYHVQVRGDFGGDRKTREKIERLVIIR